MDCHKQRFNIAKEVRDKDGEGGAICNLGNAYAGLGNCQQPKEYLKRYLSIAKRIGFRVGEGTAYGNLGFCYHKMGNFEKAME